MKSFSYLQLLGFSIILAVSAPIQAQDDSSNQSQGAIVREDKSQVGVFEVRGSGELKRYDIVSVSRNGKVLGEATVTQVGSGSCKVSLKGNYNVQSGDSISFARHMGTVKPPDEWELIASETFMGTVFSKYLETASVKQIDKDTFNCNVRTTTKDPQDKRGDRVSNYKYAIFRDGTYREFEYRVYGEGTVAGSTTSLRETGSVSDRHPHNIIKTDWVARLYYRFFPEEVH